MEGRRSVYLAFIMLVLLRSVREGATDLRLDFDGKGGDVSLGTNVKFECSSDDQKDYTPIFNTGGHIEWTRTRIGGEQPSSVEILARWSRVGGSQIELDGQVDRYSLEGNHDSGGRISQYLEIRQAQKSDQAAYRCAVFNFTGGGSWQSGELRLSVRYPPAEHYPMCTATPEELGTDVQLKCVSEETTPEVMVQWYKDNNRVSETHQHGYVRRSIYDARSDELGSTFECRLVYIDGDDVEVRRSCTFRRPYVTILENEIDQHLTDRRYYVIVHASPPLIADIGCSMESAPPSTDVPLQIEKEFPGFGVVAVGSVNNNGSVLMCHAKNVFGRGEERKTIQSQNSNIPPAHTGDDSDTEPNGLQVEIWPKNPVVFPGENLTFVCSYRLTMDSLFSAEIRVRWKYNDDPIDASGITFQGEGNTLMVSFPALHTDDHGEDDVISCVASVDGLGEVDGSQESSTLVKFGADGRQCSPHVDLSSQTDPGLMPQAPVIGVYVIVACLVVLVSVLLVVLIKKNKQQKLFGAQIVSTSQMTFRPDRSSSVGQRSESISNAVNQRALPAQPRESSTTTSTTTLRSVVTTPASSHASGTPSGALRMFTPESVSSCATSATDLPYQDMVGDTGVVRSRHGSTSSSFLPTYPEEPHSNHPRYHPGHPLASQHQAKPLGRTLSNPSTPSAMVPGPNGGFMPPSLAGRPGGIQRSMSDNDDAAPRGDLEDSYEDPDQIRERRRVQRSMSNDYQPSMAKNIDNAPMWQKNPFSSDYANSSMGDDSVFITPV